MDTAEILADLYLRLSDARLEEALAGREAKLRAKAADLGWTVYRVIIENDMVPGNGNGNGALRPASAFKRRKIRTPSGRTELRTVRPGFRDQLLADLEYGRVQAVLVEDLDRLLRQPRDGEDLLDAAEMSGATCRSLSGSLTLTNGGTDAERFTARIMVAVANKSSADTARRVRDKKEVLCGQSWQGGRRPFGYRHDPDAPKYHKRLIIDETEAAVLRQAAADVLDRDIKLRAIARDLRERGVPTVSGCAWTASTLKDILIKPMAAGLSAFHGELRPAPWPAVLERDVWERLRDKLTDPARRTGTSNEPKWLVSKFATCGVCGGLLHVTHGGGRRDNAYSGDECNHVARNAHHVDAYIAAAVVEWLAKWVPAGALKPPPRPGVDGARLRDEQKTLLKECQALMDRFAGDPQAEATIRRKKKRIGEINTQLTASNEPDPLAGIRRQIEQGRPARGAWESLTLPRQRAIVQAVIEGIAILPAGRGRPAGWKPGQTYFNPDLIQIRWRQA